MRKGLLSYGALGLILMVSSLAEALVTHTTKLGRITTEPRVKDCKKICIFENEANSWCIWGNPPVMRIGWQWQQTFGDVSAYNAVKYF